jgi:hypothetical protein
MSCQSRLPSSTTNGRPALGILEVFVTKSYTHPDADSPMRPEVGTQASLRKKKPPKSYRYDSSLSLALDWDGQNPAREEGEACVDGLSNRRRLVRRRTTRASWPG